MKKPKGTKDIFGKKQVLREYIENKLFKISKINNFSKIETPIFEKKEVFIRSIGESSDIVSKEMYLFKDKKNREMVLRPEGTAGVIRSLVENKIFIENKPIKLYYYGPMFRYERPQKGRQRQFTQFGIEVLSEKSPFIDIEIILMAKQMLDSLNIKTKLLINSLGDKETRKNYSNALKEYFSSYKEELSKDSLNRLKTNPLRILDDKIDFKKDFVKNAPKIDEFYSKENKEYFFKVLNFLDKNKIEYEWDKTLVRGLDYYSDTAFEFVSVSGNAGSQSTVLGGGRYSDLIEEFNGPKLSGIGFGMGIERIMNELNIEKIYSENNLEMDVFILNISNNMENKCLEILNLLRKENIKTEWNYKSTKIQKAFQKADLFNSKIKIIAGAKEIKNDEVIVKVKNKQEKIKINNLLKFIKKELKENYENN